MSIQIEFKRVDDHVAEYVVSIDGHSAVAKGRGASGRSLAYSALDHFRKLKAEKEKYAASLDAIAKRATETAVLTVEEAGNEELYLTAIIDGSIVYEGFDLDELLVRLTQTVGPNNNPREPAF